MQHVTISKFGNKFNALAPSFISTVFNKKKICKNTVKLLCKLQLPVHLYFSAEDVGIGLYCNVLATTLPCL
jgi:hypothetical protein